MADFDAEDAPVVLRDEDFEQLDLHQVAERLGLEPGGVIDLVNGGRLPAYRSGNTAWFRAGDVDSLR